MSRQEKLAALASTGVTKAELDNIDGGTARGTTAIADGDGVLINDAGTMRMTSVETMATYIGTKVGGGLEFIASTDISNAATTSFTGFDSSKYDGYIFAFANFLPVTGDARFYALLSVDGGSNYLSASDSYWIYGTAAASNGNSAFIPFGYNGFADDDRIGFTGNVKIIGPHLNKSTFVYAEGVYAMNGSPFIDMGISHYGNGYTKANTVVNAVQFKFSTGNIASGTITMYGMVNS